jgi:hypothetical protein
MFTRCDRILDRRASSLANGEYKVVKIALSCCFLIIIKPAVFFFQPHPTSIRSPSYILSPNTHKFTTCTSPSSSHRSSQALLPCLYLKSE